MTDTAGYNVAGRSSYTLSLIDIWVYTSSDKPLYPGLLTDIPGNSVADTGLRIVTDRYSGRSLPSVHIPGNSVADRSLSTLSLTDIVVDLCTPSVYPRSLIHRGTM